MVRDVETRPGASAVWMLLLEVCAAAARSLSSSLR